MHKLTAIAKVTPSLLGNSPSRQSKTKETGIIQFGFRFVLLPGHTSAPTMALVRFYAVDQVWPIPKSRFDNTHDHVSMFHDNPLSICGT